MKHHTGRKRGCNVVLLGRVVCSGKSNPRARDAGWLRGSRTAVGDGWRPVAIDGDQWRSMATGGEAVGDGWRWVVMDGDGWRYVPSPAPSSAGGFTFHAIPIELYSRLYSTLYMAYVLCSLPPPPLSLVAVLHER